MIENLAMVLTPPGAGAIAVVRLRGQGVPGFLASHVKKPIVEGRCVHADLVDGGKVIDDAVVVLHRAGRVVDLSVHGGPWVVRSVLGVAERAGFRIVEAGGGPLPLEMVDEETELEREVIAWLPLARTELAVKVLLAQIAAWSKLIAAAAVPGGLERAAVTAATTSALQDRALVNLLRLPQVAIVGAPNVGKSTLANQLFAQERSITADVPGTTRDWIGEIANIDGLAVMLVDTPGVRETLDPIEREAIEASRGVVRGADLTVVVLDASQAAEGQRGMLDTHPGALVVANKSDRPSLWEPPQDAMKTMATTGEGVDALRRAILERFDCAEIDLAQPRSWTERQRALLEDRLGP